MQENKFKKIQQQKMSLKTSMCLLMPQMFLVIIKKGKTQNQTENTKEQLGVMAVIAIMEPATERQSSRAYKQPLRCHPSNIIRVLLDSGSNGDFISYQMQQNLSLPN